MFPELDARIVCPLGVGNLAGRPLRNGCSVYVLVLPGQAFLTVAELLIEGHGLRLRYALTAEMAGQLSAALRRRGHSPLVTWSHDAAVLHLGLDDVGLAVNVLISAALGEAVRAALDHRRECCHIRRGEINVSEDTQLRELDALVDAVFDADPRELVRGFTDKDWASLRRVEERLGLPRGAVFHGGQ